MVALFSFLKGMMGALAAFSYLVFYSIGLDNLGKLSF
jgi:hypothetical protein